MSVYQEPKGEECPECGQVRGAVEFLGGSLQRAGHDFVTLYEERVKLAWDVLSLALTGGMPDSYWLTDQRITRACEALGMDASEARDAATAAAIDAQAAGS